MQYTGLISVVKTGMPGWHHFGHNITQTSVFLDFLKSVPDGKWSLKIHKNQCVMNDQLLCGNCWPTYSEATGCNTLG